jgi:hypothetical protein
MEGMEGMEGIEEKEGKEGKSFPLAGTCFGKRGTS